MTDALVARGLVKTYRGRAVVDDVDVEVRPGEIVALIGPNGAGKTTTFQMILGIVKPDRGTVAFGRPLDGLPLHHRARLGLGYLPQGPSVLRGLTARDNLLALLEALGRPEPAARADALLERFDLGRIAHQKAHTLSGGERRRLELARSLCSDPRVLLCDEPFSGVDPIAVEGIARAMTRLADSGVGVLLTDHNVRDALRLAGRVYLMVDGRIVDHGPPDSIVSGEPARRLYLGPSFSS